MGEVFGRFEKDFGTTFFVMALIIIVALIGYAVYIAAEDFIYILGETASIENITANPYLW